jgi:hypothetical protein
MLESSYARKRARGTGSLSGSTVTAALLPTVTVTRTGRFGRAAAATPSTSKPSRTKKECGHSRAYLCHITERHGRRSEDY